MNSNIFSKSVDKCDEVYSSQKGPQNDTKRIREHWIVVGITLMLGLGDTVQLVDLLDATAVGRAVNCSSPLQGILCIEQLGMRMSRKIYREPHLQWDGIETQRVCRICCPRIQSAIQSCNSQVAGVGMNNFLVEPQF